MFRTKIELQPKTKTMLLWMCCYRYWFEDEILSRKSSLNNRLSLKADLRLKHYTAVYNTMLQDLTSANAGLKPALTVSHRASPLEWGRLSKCLTVKTSQGMVVVGVLYNPNFVPLSQPSQQMS